MKVGVCLLIAVSSCVLFPVVVVAGVPAHLLLLVKIEK